MGPVETEHSVVPVASIEHVAAVPVANPPFRKPRALLKV